MRWNKQTILVEIRQFHGAGEALSFCAVQENHPHLMRAAVWHFGSWKAAVEAAGFVYESVAKYQFWTRQRVIEAIRRHHAAGHDLSWRSVSTFVDPCLAAAALRPHLGFSSWRDALQAAGLNPAEIARYRRWSGEQIVLEIREMARQNQELSSQLARQRNQALFCAAIRHFGSWKQALQCADIDPDLIGRQRKTSPRRRSARASQPTLAGTPLR